MALGSKPNFVLMMLTVTSSWTYPPKRVAEMALQGRVSAIFIAFAAKIVIGGHGRPMVVGRVIAMKAVLGFHLYQLVKNIITVRKDLGIRCVGMRKGMRRRACTFAPFSQHGDFSLGVLFHVG